MHITNRLGGIVNSYEYDAFGHTLSATEGIPNRFRYAGEQFDPVTQQYYLRARFYNPVIARFTQEDEYRGDGLNLYAYVGNNPIRYVDPSGYSSQNVGCGGGGKKEGPYEGMRTPRMGDADYQGELPAKSWILTLEGDGAHLIERVNVRDRTDLAHFDQKGTPRYYPAGSPENAGQAHIRLHAATKRAGIKLRGGNPQMSDAELIERYSKAYSDLELEGILGALRTPNSSLTLGKDLAPAEAFEKLLEWGKENSDK